VLLARARAKMRIFCFHRNVGSAMVPVGHTAQRDRLREGLKIGYVEHSRRPKTNVISLKVISKPEKGTRTVLETSPDAKSSMIIRVTWEGNPGPKGINYIFGKCGALLIVGAARNQIRNVVLHCRNCDSYNDLP